MIIDELAHPEWTEEKIKALMEHYKAILKLLGEDTTREGLLKTPERISKAMLTLTRGYDQDPKQILMDARFKEPYSQMVIVKDIDFFSLCEHHMLPFYGKAHVGYIPNGYITGLSKIARVVDVFSRKVDPSNQGMHSGDTSPAGRNGCIGGKAHVHADARC